MEPTMNDWNQLETQLRTWTPRAPSRKIKASLFAPRGPHRGDASAIDAKSDTNVSNDGPPFSWQWFAPSMALVIITAFLLPHQSAVLAGLSSTPSPAVIAEAALSEPGLSTYYVSTRHSENNMPVVGLEWTNGPY